MANSIYPINTNKPILRKEPSEISNKQNINSSQNTTSNILSQIVRNNNKPSDKTETKGIGGKIESLLSNGVDYLKSVRNKADLDRKNGVKTLEGANKLWEQLVTKAEGFGKKSEDAVLNGFVKDSTAVIEDQLKSTKANDYLSAFFGDSKAATTEADTFKKAPTTGAAGLQSASEVKDAASVGTSTTSSLSQVESGVGAAYALYKLFDDFGESSPMVSGMHGATVGAYAGSFFGPMGTAIGGVVGFIGGGILGMFSKHKHPEAIMRDNMRTGLKDGGMLDKDNNVQLADGSKFSFDQEKANLVNTDGTKRTGYQIDFSNKLTAQTIGWMQPLAEVMTGGNKKLKTDLLGYMVNAVTSNVSSLDQAKENALSLYSQSKVKIEDIVGGMEAMKGKNMISEDDFNAYANGLVTLLGTNETEKKDAA